MKRITDERLILVNLKNFRIAYIFQTVGMLAVLIYIAFTSGSREAIESPFFLVMMLTNILLIFLQMRVTADVEATEKKCKTPVPYYVFVLISLAVGVLMGLISWFTDRQHPSFAWISGTIFFVCFLGSFSFMYYLKKKRANDDDEE
ncbi:branched-chain amino acid ABC transporter substrate-binding protein [Sporolactobacillus shoreicorticis]|uniref:Branched-chain amino acid ABC transporter substrate-binding protein n=1 Tax=Sporolactobacillus shoreicorticis TaxID=1923877 RepID=A0ABW5S3J2_9BACL|nr:branched-chain amino acid ABC transporter substrate-binding protein [Sporolactobacillus shoreicorticis]MCO7126439.1 branched-chain amino acid ABC transporter substrate-binding protein [Sporolactobacillus shoreicorticis]